MGKKGIGRRAPPRTSWEAMAHWYNGWVGEEGSDHHRKLAIPAVLELLELQASEKVLDIGAGQGVLAPYIVAEQAHYTAIEGSPTMLKYAKQHHGKSGRFIQGDAAKLAHIPELYEAEFDAAVFLLSIQDMGELNAVLSSAAWALKAGGRLVILMTHPCFRIPRQSGWGWDENRKLRFRRIDRYLTPLPVPMKEYKGQDKGTTVSFHRPLEHYINGLADCGLVVNQMREIATYKVSREKAEHQANQEIPLFLGLRAHKPKDK